MNSTILSYRARFGGNFFPAAVAIAALISAASAQIVIIDGFELGEGHFASNPNTASGTSQGFFKVAPNDAKADQILSDAFTGTASQRITLFDDPAVAGSGANQDSWRLRHLSGGGSPANNLSLAVVVGETSYVGYWLKTTSPDLEAAIGIDDGAALEIARWQPIIADGQWHFYEWQFQDEADWNAFAGTGPNGAIDGTSVTIDSVFIRGGVGVPTGSSFNADVVIDDVSYNQTGSAVPEPSSAVTALVGLAMVMRRRRK